MLFFRAEGDMKDSYTIHEIAALYGVGRTRCAITKSWGLSSRAGRKTATASTTSTTSTD